MKNSQIKNVVILGGGTAGWMVAAALSKYLANADSIITLVESPDIGTVGVGEATIPIIRYFNNALGISEVDFMRETKATFKLGIFFKGWGTTECSYFHPFGTYGAEMEGVSFQQYFLRWLDQGRDLNINSFSLEAMAASSNRFSISSTPNTGKHFASLNYAYHFDASLYASFLKKYAETRGVKRVEGTVTHVNRCVSNGYVESLILEGGREIVGGFFIDCSGLKSILLGGTFQSEFTDWSHWLPADRALAVPTPVQENIVPYTKSTALSAGWSWEIPLQHRTGNGYVYCSNFISDEEASEELIRKLNYKHIGSPRLLKFKTGVRKESWIKNCVAIGLSAGFLEPLESTSIHLIQVAIAKLIKMFPNDRIDESMATLFNKEMSYEYSNIKDFIVAHYKVGSGQNTEFWRLVQSMDIPQTLEEKLERFKERGEVFVEPNELFKETSWFSVLYGQGLKPRGYNPMVGVLENQELNNRMNYIANSVGGFVNSLPLHKDFISYYIKS